MTARSLESIALRVHHRAAADGVTARSFFPFAIAKHPPVDATPSQDAAPDDTVTKGTR